MVWINALVVSAGGQILKNPEAGKDVQPSIDSDAGRAAAQVIQQLAHSKAANPALSTSKEETGRTAFQGPNGGFMLNWSYIYGAEQEAVQKGTLDQSVLDDVGWARYPQVMAGTPSRPPLGGINIGVSPFTDHTDLAVDAAKCITSKDHQKEYMLSAKKPRGAQRRVRRPRGAPGLPDGRPHPRVDRRFGLASADPVLHGREHGGRALVPSACVGRSQPDAEEVATLIVDVLHDRKLL